MENKFKNYIRVKIFESYWHREEIKDYEVKFDQYKRINVMGHASYNRWFEYKGRSIVQLKKMLDNITVKPRGEYVTEYDWNYKDCFLEVIEINIPDNPKENEIFDKFPDLYLKLSDEAIIFLLPELKKFVTENIKKEPNAVINFPERINLEFPRWSFFNIEGEYGYNKTGKPRCKLKHFSYNPGGRFWFSERQNFTKIQNLIKAYIEND
jgi:hypothetical protein